MYYHQPQFRDHQGHGNSWTWVNADSFTHINWNSQINWRNTSIANTWLAGSATLKHVAQFFQRILNQGLFLVRGKDLSTEEDSFAAVAEAAITRRNNNGPPMDKDMSWIQGIDSSHLLCLLWINSYAPFWSFTQQRRWNHQPGFAVYIDSSHLFPTLCWWKTVTSPFWLVAHAS